MSTQLQIKKPKNNNWKLALNKNIFAQTAYPLEVLGFALCPMHERIDGFVMGEWTVLKIYERMVVLLEIRALAAPLREREVSRILSHGSHDDRVRPSWRWHINMSHIHRAPLPLNETNDRFASSEVPRRNYYFIDECINYSPSPSAAAGCTCHWFFAWRLKLQLSIKIFHHLWESNIWDMHERIYGPNCGRVADR